MRRARNSRTRDLIFFTTKITKNAKATDQSLRHGIDTVQFPSLFSISTTAVFHPLLGEGGETIRAVPPRTTGRLTAIGTPGNPYTVIRAVAPARPLQDAAPVAGTFAPGLLGGGTDDRASAGSVRVLPPRRYGAGEPPASSSGSVRVLPPRRVTVGRSSLEDGGGGIRVPVEDDRGSSGS